MQILTVLHWRPTNELSKTSDHYYPHPRDSEFMVLAWGQGVGIFLKLPRLFQHATLVDAGRSLDMRDNESLRWGFV